MLWFPRARHTRVPAVLPSSIRRHGRRGTWSCLRGRHSVAPSLSESRDPGYPHLVPPDASCWPGLVQAEPARWHTKSLLSDHDFESAGTSLRGDRQESTSYLRDAYLFFVSVEVVLFRCPHACVKWARASNNRWQSFAPTDLPPKAYAGNAFLGRLSQDMQD